MEDAIEVILQDQSSKFTHQHNHRVTVAVGGLLAGLYGLWTMFVLPGFRKVPFKLKVPYLPSSNTQTQNVMKLLDGRRGHLADLGSGDGRLVFAASSLGLQSTGFEINSILLSYARTKARWMGIPSTNVNFVNKDFWMADLSRYNNVTMFLAPGVMDVLEEKLLLELPDDARVIACRFPFARWPATCSEGSGLDQVWAYDMSTLRKPPASPRPV
ncbi:ATP synthase subunit C lysine N-methyltransferase isoform X1 [Amia ocellicauda]|uniref:ATP synthase subunit C lysine N-methyltransferase isoform X1 n=1 Tax=Amia ocellicauda TaxID=2972642 RepID=UPI003463B687